MLPRYGPLSMSSISLVHLTWWLDTRSSIAAYMSCRMKLRFCGNVFGDHQNTRTTVYVAFRPLYRKAQLGLPHTSRMASIGMNRDAYGLWSAISVIAGAVPLPYSGDRIHLPRPHAIPCRCCPLASCCHSNTSSKF